MQRISRQPARTCTALATTMVVVVALAAALSPPAAAHFTPGPGDARWFAHAQSTAASNVDWCGNDAVETDRVPDQVASNQLHVAYVIPSDGADRFNTFASKIASDIAAIGAWWKTQDATRSLRWDLFAFPGCEGEFSRLDISSIRLPRTAATYDVRDFQLVANNLLRDLVQPPSNFDQDGKKYVLFYDGPTKKMDACGLGTEAGYAFMFLQPPNGCPPVDVGAGRFAASVTAHEIVHALGAMPRGAPHPCPGDLGHSCDNPKDIIHGKPETQPLSYYLLDPGHDDYYAHSGSWFDMQESLWLSRLGSSLFELTVSTKGQPGRVVSDVPGVDCPPSCISAWESGTKVTLTAVPAQGNRFTGWSGACAGRLPKCSVTIDKATTLTGSFEASSGGGSGGTKENVAPTAAFTLRSATFPTGQEIRFLSRSRDLDGRIVSMDWDFGDGASGSGYFVTHAYKKEGLYTARLTVTDDDGAKGQATQRIAVTNPAPSVQAFPAFGLRGKVLKLGFLVRENTAIKRVDLEILRGKARVARVKVKTPLESSFTQAAWRAPKQKLRATWCVQVWDDAGKPSSRECAKLRVL